MDFSGSCWNNTDQESISTNKDLIMNPLRLALILAIFGLVAAFALILACGGGGSDEDDDDRMAEFTCPDYITGNNPHDPGTPECDDLCIQWDDQWQLELTRRYVECIGTTPIGSSNDICLEAASTCMEKAQQQKKQCAEACNGCLIESIECDAACAVSAKTTAAITNAWSSFTIAMTGTLPAITTANSSMDPATTRPTTARNWSNVLRTSSIAPLPAGKCPPATTMMISWKSEKGFHGSRN
jgi:hypothetical protein